MFHGRNKKFLKISTQLLTLLTACVIVWIEQKCVTESRLIPEGGALMNINKFTQKSMEAVQNCEKLAYEYGNQQIEQEHLFYSLLS